MIRKLFATALLAGISVVPVTVEARPHAGCAASAASPTCTYTAIGGHQCAGATEASWEVFVIRIINGEPRKVVLASGTGAIVGESVDAFPNESVTQTIAADGPGGYPTGVVTCGNTAGHP